VKVMIAVAVCVVIDDDRDPSKVAAVCRNPLDDLIARMRREMRCGRDLVKWRKPDGAKVA